VRALLATQRARARAIGACQPRQMPHWHPHAGGGGLSRAAPLCGMASAGVGGCCCCVSRIQSRAGALNTRGSGPGMRWRRNTRSRLRRAAPRCP
jgi:hypothetical protein